MENNTFSYSYSAQHNNEIKQIREKYAPRQESKLEQLRRLDRTVQSSGVTAALMIGVPSSCVFGIAMCMVLGQLGGGVLAGAIIGAVGALGMLMSYPINCMMIKRTKAALTPKILQLLDEIETSDTAVQNKK